MLLCYLSFSVIDIVFTFKTSKVPHADICCALKERITYFHALVQIAWWWRVIDYTYYFE